MLSRVAESTFWMSRYIERAENTARFIDVNLRLILDTPMDIGLQWEPMIKITDDAGLFAQQYDDMSQENVIEFLVFSRNYPNSVASCVTRARENARSIRETISIEIWRCINEFHLYLQHHMARIEASDSPNSFFTKIKNYSQLLSGIAESTMVHNEGWHFFRMGQLLERADKTSRILDVKYFMLLPRLDYVGTAYDTLQWAALLRSTSALDMYRKQYHQITPTNVFRFLFFDTDFPRSIKFCLRECDLSVHDITGAPTGSYSTMAERSIGMLRAEIDYADVDEIMCSGLHEYIDSFQMKLNKIGDAISNSFFTAQPLNQNIRKRRR